MNLSEGLDTNMNGLTDSLSQKGLRLIWLHSVNSVTSAAVNYLLQNPPVKTITLITITPHYRILFVI